MNGAEVAQIITSLATLVAAMTGLMVSLGNRAKIKAVVVATDGMKDQLVAATKISSRSEGRDEERRNPTP